VRLSRAIVCSIAWVVVGAPGCGGDPEPTERPPTRSAETDPEHARLRQFWTLFGQATEARVAGRCDEATELYRAALAIDPEHEDSLFYLGHCLAQAGAYPAALARWRQLVEVQPHAKRGFTEIGILLSSGADGAPFDLIGARTAFEAAFDMNPEESGSLLHLGELAVATGDDDDARRWLAGLERTNPRSVAGPFLLGYLAWIDGDAARAGDALGRAALRLETEREHAPSFEGQTESGAAAMLAEGAVGRSLLGPFWGAWGGARRPTEEVTPAEVEATYAAIERYLGELRENGPDAARALRPPSS